MNATQHAGMKLRLAVITFHQLTERSKWDKRYEKNSKEPRDLTKMIGPVRLTPGTKKDARGQITFDASHSDNEYPHLFLL